MEGEKISVIVPVYKVEAYLHKCVDSILAQTYENLEVLLIDDGSPDGCPALCDGYAAQDCRVKVFHKENGGVSSARNLGLDRATGDWIGFVDSDDWIEPDMYESLLELAAESGTEIVQCGFCQETPETNGYWEGERGRGALQGDDGVRKILAGDVALVSLWSKLFQRKLFDGVRQNEHLHCCEDMLMIYELVKKESRIFYSEVCKYHYVRHGDSAMAGKLQAGHIEDSFTFSNILLEQEKDSALVPHCVKRRIDSCFFLLGSIVRNNNFWDRYPGIRQEVLSRKKEIWTGALYPMKYKLATALLWLCPPLYNVVILVRRKIRGF